MGTAMLPFGPASGQQPFYADEHLAPEHFAHAHALAARAPRRAARPEWDGGAQIDYGGQERHPPPPSPPVLTGHVSSLAPY
jgi:hypothetical protein